MRGTVRLNDLVQLSPLASARSAKYGRRLLLQRAVRFFSEDVESHIVPDSRHVHAHDERGRGGEEDRGAEERRELVEDEPFVSADDHQDARDAEGGAAVSA